MRHTAMILMSGGIDSCVCAALARQEHDLAFLHFDYGQLPNKKELEAFWDIADFYRIEDRMVINAFPSFSLQRSGNIQMSYVPFRNAVFLSIAANRCEATGISRIYIGATRDDRIDYPDCRKEFYQAFNQLLQVGSKTEIEVVAPLLHLSKLEVIKRGMELNAPIHLTWSCYQDDEVPCKQCHSCRERQMAFEALGITDV